MLKISTRYVLILLLFINTLLPVSSKTLSLNGAWEYLPLNVAELSDSIKNQEWPKMQLPSNWFLMGDKQYPQNLKSDPEKLASNAPGKLWPIDISKGLNFSGTVWFKKNIEIPLIPDNPILLELNMVDYYCDVYVNGQLVNNHEGYFQPWKTNITNFLNLGSNEILLKVSAPKQIFDMSMQYPVSWPKHQNQIKGIFAYHDTRPGATSYLGQDRGTGGVIGDINLLYSGGIDFDLVKIHTEKLSSNSALMSLRYEIMNWTKKNQLVNLYGFIQPKNFSNTTSKNFSDKLILKPGMNSYKKSIVIQSPKLWWTWDTGFPHLYNLKSQLINNKVILDEQSTLFGIRTITRDNDFACYLNGKKIFLRGSNYISTQWLSQADKDFYQKDIDLIKDANLNTVRVHAHIEKPIFYDIADRNGVLIWQDYPLQWGYADSDTFIDEAVRQAKDMVNYFYNHPSIILWCMHNEAPYAMEWMEKKNPQQNFKLDEKLYNAVKLLDSTRIVHRDSGTGDAHLYPGWYQVPLWEMPSVDSMQFEKMITEYGAQALPKLETLKKMFNNDTLWPDTAYDWEVWKYANFQPDQTFKTAGISQGRNISEFIKNSQQYQVNLIKFVTERLRQLKWKKSTGLYHFMFVDDWPSITWSVVDYYRNPKDGYFTLKQVMQPLFPSIKYTINKPEEPLEIIVINDYLESFNNLNLKWQIGDGSVSKKNINIEANSILHCFYLGYLKEVTEGNNTLKVWIEDQKGNVLSTNQLQKKNFISKMQSKEN